MTPPRPTEPGYYAQIAGMPETRQWIPPRPAEPDPPTGKLYRVVFFGNHVVPGEHPSREIAKWSGDMVAELLQEMTDEFNAVIKQRGGRNLLPEVTYQIVEVKV